MIAAGTILIDKNAQRPQCFQLEDESSPHAWMSLQHNLTPHEREAALSAAGWTFFFMANPIRATSFGFHPARMMQAALKRLVATSTEQKCNCLQIDDVTTHSFLGVPYVSVSAHPRHIQRGMVFSG